MSHALKARLHAHPVPHASHALRVKLHAPPARHVHPGPRAKRPLPKAAPQKDSAAASGAVAIAAKALAQLRAQPLLLKRLPLQVANN